MSTNYYPNIIKETKVYNNTLNPIYQDPQKRNTIYENIKVLKPIVLPAKRNESYISNDQIVNYNNNNNATLVSEYPMSNYNQINTEDTINNYFNQTTTELPSENNYENYFNNTDININNKTNNNKYYEKYFTQTTTEQIIPNEIEFAKIKRITNDNDNNITNNNIININQNQNQNQNVIKKANVNKIQIITNEPKQKITQEKEIAQVRKITEENILKTPEEKIIKPVTIPSIQNNNINNINNLPEKKNIPMVYPGPAKISKMPNVTIPLNPRVRVAREEKKINIVKLTEDNSQNINNNIINTINNEEILNNDNNININNNNEKEIMTFEEEKEENPIINNINFNKTEIQDEIIPKTEINEINEIIENIPVNDYNLNSKTPDRKFHRVKILKKNPSNQLFPHSKLLDLENYNSINTPKIYNMNKINTKLSKLQKKEGNPFIMVKKIIPKKINDKDIFIDGRYENENENNNSDRHSSDFEDDFGNFNDDEVKDTDEINYNNYNNFNKNIRDNKENNEIREIKKEDSYVKKIKNNDVLDEFDNNFYGHEKFFKKMKNLFDD